MPYSKSSCQKTTYPRYRKGAFFFLFPKILERRLRFVTSRGQILHILVKYNDNIRRVDTIQEHRSIADQSGSVWWGKFGVGIARNKVEKVLNQIESGIPTFLYLACASSLFGTNVILLTLSAHSGYGYDSSNAVQTLRNSLHYGGPFHGPCRSRRREYGTAPPTLLLHQPRTSPQASSRSVPEIGRPKTAELAGS